MLYFRLSAVETELKELRPALAKLETELDISQKANKYDVVYVFIH